jgi:hypothetical protein
MYCADDDGAAALSLPPFSAVQGNDFMRKRYPRGDALNSTIALTNSSGSIVDQTTNDPYGNSSCYRWNFCGKFGEPCSNFTMSRETRPLSATSLTNSIKA